MKQGKTTGKRALSLTLALLLGLMAWGFAGVNTAARAATATAGSWGELETAINGASGPTTITLTANFDADSEIVILGDKDITIDGGTHTITRQIGFTGKLFSVYGSLRLENITLDGAGAAGQGLIIFVNGKVTLGSGCLLKNNHGQDAGGVFVNSNGVLWMEGDAEIADCKGLAQGGGVNNEGKFTMKDDAKITGCEASGNNSIGGGGVYNGKFGVFTMEGNASITDCEVTNPNSGIGGGGGVYNNGDFTMNGGEIYENSSGGDGGGVYNNSGFTMNGGKIYENFSGGNGGGVYTYGNFTMKGGEISGNTATEKGGGVYNEVVLLMYGGEISGNTATGGSGHEILHEFGIAYADMRFGGGSVVGKAGSSYGVATTGTNLNTSGVEITVDGLTTAARIVVEPRDKLIILVLNMGAGKVEEHIEVTDGTGTVISHVPQGSNVYKYPATQGSYFIVTGAAPRAVETEKKEPEKSDDKGKGPAIGGNTTPAQLYVGRAAIPSDLLLCTGGVITAYIHNDVETIANALLKGEPVRGIAGDTSMTKAILCLRAASLSPAVRSYLISGGGTLSVIDEELYIVVDTSTFTPPPGIGHML